MECLGTFLRRFANLCVVILLLSGCETGSPVSHSSQNFSGSPKSRDNKPVLSATPWHDYEKQLFNKVSENWTCLLDKENPKLNEHGQVTLQFVLTSDGQVKELKVTESYVSKRLTDFCAQAILDSAPFPAWPAEVRKSLGKDAEYVYFKFHYLK